MKQTYTMNEQLFFWRSGGYIPDEMDVYFEKDLNRYFEMDTSSSDDLSDSVSTDDDSDDGDLEYIEPLRKPVPKKKKFNKKAH